MIGIDLIITGVEYLSMCFYYFLPYEYSLPLETDFLKLGPVWNSVLLTYPRTFLEGRCHLLATVKSSSVPVLWFPCWLSGKESTCSAGDLQETRVQSLGWEDALEKEMATRSSILAWRRPWTEEPGGLRSIGLPRARHN